MSEMRIDAPFGRVALRSPVGAAGETRDATPDLPPGLRLSGARTGALAIAFGAGESVEVTLACDLGAGCRADRTAGDGMVGWEVTGPGLAAAYALPDAEALKRHFGLEIAGFHESNAQASFRLRSEHAQVAEIPFAAAWTLDPVNDEDSVAPWMALDPILSA